MERLKEKQLTLRASRRPVEYNYTNADIHHANTTPHDGYQFEYPVNWAGDPSTNKVIGIRRINYKPTSVDIAVRFQVSYGGNTYTFDVPGVFTDQNSFEECISKLILEVQGQIFALETVNITVASSYNKETGDFTLSFTDGTPNPPAFKILFPVGGDAEYDGSDRLYDEQHTHYRKEFLKLFNQELTKSNVDNLLGKGVVSMTELKFNNVWNRDSFYCHASFSDSPKQIIGINHDFWYTPSVFYEHSDNSNDFNVYFTTDTVHRILPRNGVMLIQLSYIFNYATSMLTYA